MTNGSVEPLKKLYADWGDRIHFIEVLVRQAHPGPGVEAYRTFDQKLEEARRYKDEEAIPWPVLVDDVEGTVHQVYGTLADPTYLIDADGRVAYYNMWTHAPNLHLAISTLVEQGGHGVVNGGVDRVVHALPAITHGWKGLRRGWPQSYIDMEIASPGTAALIRAGYAFRRVLEPVTLRSRPLPFPVKPLLLSVLAAFALRQLARKLRK